MRQITRTFTLPGLDTQASQDDVRGALAGAPGVDTFDFDLPNRRVTVLMDDPEAEPDVRIRLNNAGYPAES